MKLLAFGDSLTEGWCDYGRQTHPYSTILSSLLEEHFPGKYEVHNDGIAGEETSAMPERLQKLLDSNTYSHVIILAGTNDLGKRFPQITQENLQRMYTQVKEANATVVAITIPESFCRASWYIQKRTEINTWIRANASCSFVVDLEVLIPWNSNSELWDDGLHLSPAGYDQLGGFVFNTLRESLGK